MLHLSLSGRPHLRLDQDGSGNMLVASLPIAVLARLAVAGSSGISSDLLLALIWPDAEEAKAAHRLTQVRYALRKALGVAPISGVLHLSLDGTVLSDDVDRLTSEITGRDWEIAANIAERPFMDSFSLRDSPDFERWMEEQRLFRADRHRTGEASGGGRGACELRAIASKWHRQGSSSLPVFRPP